MLIYVCESTCFKFEFSNSHFFVLMFISSALFYLKAKLFRIFKMTSLTDFSFYNPPPNSFHTQQVFVSFHPWF